MDIDFDAESWFGNPTPLEMMRQQLLLVETENELLRSQVERYRLNQSKLIRMLTVATEERDAFRRDAHGCSRKLSDLYVHNAQLTDKLNELQFVHDRSQSDAAMICLQDGLRSSASPDTAYQHSQAK